jgi:3',5'-cyclic AMP phosphodiesterase CpdA
MKLYAISDLHVGHAENLRAIEALRPHPRDWLIVAGDVGDTLAQIDTALALLRERFARLLWVPGNHDLWTLEDDPAAPRGEARYRALVDLCRRHDILTPEDPFVAWEGEGPRCILAPMFLLYDYTFRPDHVAEGQEIAWALETDVYCSDETYLFPDPHPNRAAWCEARCRLTAARLAEAARESPLVLINHFPLIPDQARLPACPRFSIWCGTRRTAQWHREFRALSVVYGHLHIRSTTRRDGVRFDEVSLGYPRHWRPERGLEAYLREVLPGDDNKLS